MHKKQPSRDGNVLFKQLENACSSIYCGYLPQDPTHSCIVSKDPKNQVVPIQSHSPCVQWYASFPSRNYNLGTRLINWLIINKLQLMKSCSLASSRSQTLYGMNATVGSGTETKSHVARVWLQQQSRLTILNFVSQLWSDKIRYRSLGSLCQLKILITVANTSTGDI